jgi:hypothetical protein
VVGRQRHGWSQLLRGIPGLRADRRLRPASPQEA